MIRALRGAGIFLVGCRMANGSLNVGIALVDSTRPCPATVTVTDIDTGQQYQVHNPATGYGLTFRISDCAVLPNP